MNVVYHSSDSFAKVLGVSLVSLYENNKELDEINTFIIEKEISSENQSILISIAEKYNRKMTFIPMKDVNEFEELHLKKVINRWIFDGYWRIFLDDILPENIEKVLFLDSDTLVTDSLKELWDTDLTDNAAAGVKDCLNKKYYRLLGLKEGAHYCNSGVILINLKKWREDKMGDRFREYVHDRNGYIYFMEQTVLNGVMQDKWKILDVRYNVNTVMMSIAYKELRTLRKIDDFYSEEEVKEANEHPAIIHMTNTFLVRNRAWVENTNHPASEIYQKYKAISPWADETDYPDKRGIKTKIRDKLIEAIPNSVLLPCVGFVYNNIRTLDAQRRIKKYSE